MYNFWMVITSWCCCYWLLFLLQSAESFVLQSFPPLPTLTLPTKTTSRTRTPTIFSFKLTTPTRRRQRRSRRYTPQLLVQYFQNHHHHDHQEEQQQQQQQRKIPTRRTLRLPPNHYYLYKSSSFSSCRYVGSTTILSSRSQQQNTEEEKQLTTKTRQKRRTWEENYQLLVSYKEKHGNCNVPQKYKDDSRLGSWVRSQRKRKDRLSHERIVKLNDLGFSWSNEINEEQWEEMFQKLVQYAKENNGDCNIPRKENDDDDNKELRIWVRTQRLRKSLLSKERQSKLDNIGLIWEDSKKVKADQKWNEKYEQLQEYKQKYGHCRVPKTWKEDRALGLWVYTQRQYFKNGLLGEDRQMKLEEMDFTWKVRDGTRPDYAKLDFQWLVKFGILLNFLEKHGHCDVPRRYKKDNSQSLGLWVNDQRVSQRNGSLHGDRKELFDDIGFTWRFDDQRDEQWNEKYQELKTFKEMNGHLRLPETFRSLIAWVSRQRIMFAAGKVTPERKAMLDEIGLKLE